MGFLFTCTGRSTKESWNVLSVEEAFLFLLGLSSRQRLQLLILKLDLGDANWLLGVSLLRGYPWLTKLLHREVVIEGQDKVFKDVIEPLESVSVNMILPSNKIFETLVLHNRFSMYTLPPDIFHHRGGCWNVDQKSFSPTFTENKTNRGKRARCWWESLLHNRVCCSGSKFYLPCS